MTRPLLPRARQLRPTHNGVGRPRSSTAEAVSDTMRLAADPLSRARRRVAAYNLGAIAALLPVAAYQTGLIGHLPEPPIPLLDADRVDASGEAYFTLQTADVALGIASYAGTVALAAMGGDQRYRRRPWLAAAFSAKVLADALGGLLLTAEQATKHRRFCGYCLIATTLSVLAVGPAINETRRALEAKRPL